MKWTIEIVSAASTEIDALPIKLRARLARLLAVVEKVGLEKLRTPHARHLEGKLRELRVKAESGTAGGICVTASGRRVAVPHVFVKKSRKTPRRALETATERARQVEPRRR